MEFEPGDAVQFAVWDTGCRTFAPDPDAPAPMVEHITTRLAPFLIRSGAHGPPHPTRQPSVDPYFTALRGRTCLDPEDVLLVDIDRRGFVELTDREIERDLRTIFETDATIVTEADVVMGGNFADPTKLEDIPPLAETLERLREILSTPVLTRVDAPSTIAPEIRAALMVHDAGIPTYLGDLPPLIPPIMSGSIRMPVEIDQALPMRTVRYHFSDGTTRMEKLG